MVTVKRYDYPERVIKYRTGKTKTIEAFHECYYYHNNIEVAMYDSKDDVLYLKTKYIERDWNKSTYDRALSGQYKEIYSYLFSMLNVDETSRLSEYMNM